VFTGLAVDAGRAYVVKAQLSKAVDGAALGAARMLNSGDPKGEATRIFKANFPTGYLGTSSVTDPTTDPGFFSLRTDVATGENIVSINASAILPASFMRVANVQQLTVTSRSEARRRMVDLSLVLDVSSSLGAKWGSVRDAARAFINSFDPAGDRIALMTFSNGARVLDQMPSSHGFDKAKVMADVPDALPGGSTAMVEGLYHGWDELRTVPTGQQSGLRVIVLFTDGASNSVPGIYEAAPGVARGLRTFDFPKNLPDPDGQTWNNPQINALFDTLTGAQNPSYNMTVANWNNYGPGNFLTQVPYLPVTSYHANHRSGGIPTSFPLQTNALMVNGTPQATIRGLRHFDAGHGRYPAEVFNINNAARNLLEIVADAARSDGSGTYPIRIYTIGMGELVRYMLGTMPEKPEDILMRVANDTRSPDYNAGQLEGKYYYARTEADIGPAFQALASQITRLSK
jgi:Mg-chelatase subunit ChlD